MALDPGRDLRLWIDGLRAAWGFTRLSRSARRARALGSPRSPVLQDENWSSFLAALTSDRWDRAMRGLRLLGRSHLPQLVPQLKAWSEDLRHLNRGSERDRVLMLALVYKVVRGRPGPCGPCIANSSWRPLESGHGGAQPGPGRTGAVVRQQRSRQWGARSVRVQLSGRWDSSLEGL